MDSHWRNRHTTLHAHCAPAGAMKPRVRSSLFISLRTALPALRSWLQPHRPTDAFAKRESSPLKPC